MRNWMLTPIIVAGLAGVGFDFRNPRRDPAPSVQADGVVVLAGSHLSLRQLGPVRAADDEVVIALRHHAGPCPDELRAWVDAAHAAAPAVVTGPAADQVTVLRVALPERLRSSRLWLEAAVGDQRGRAAFVLER